MNCVRRQSPVGSRANGCLVRPRFMCESICSFGGVHSNVHRRRRVIASRFLTTVRSVGSRAVVTLSDKVRIGVKSVFVVGPGLGLESRGSTSNGVCRGICRRNRLVPTDRIIVSNFRIGAAHRFSGRFFVGCNKGYDHVP